MFEIFKIIGKSIFTNFILSLMTGAMITAVNKIKNTKKTYVKNLFFLFKQTLDLFKILNDRRNKELAFCDHQHLINRLNTSLNYNVQINSNDYTLKSDDYYWEI
ncbi:hypothetical protein BpHYR1_035754 [Brachionus plicatilis]|uniref:Uncharacterized protein n=1 Tax=Brachionus plicatilis TaxID=10195 RepID=A0A3M7SSG7_BRAPC|nr:hypothetical protein BpHYR1_035754 [Brachionus plicatilis]